MLNISIVSNCRSLFYKKDFISSSLKTKESPKDIFQLSFKGNYENKEEPVTLLEENKEYYLYPVKRRELFYPGAKKFLETIRYDNPLKKYTILKDNRVTGDYIAENKEAIEYVQLLDSVNSPKLQRELVSAFCDETGFPSFEKVTDNINKEITTAVHLLSQRRNFDVRFIGYDSNCSVGRGVPLPGTDCDALFVIIEPKSTNIPYIAEGTRWMLKDNINQRILSTPALSLPEVLTTDYIKQGLDLAEKTFKKANFSKKDLERFEMNINDNSTDFVKAGEFNIRLAELLPNDKETRDLFYKTAMLVELVRSGTILENDFSPEFISKIKKSPLYKYSNIIRQEGLKNKIKHKHQARKQLEKDFYEMFNCEQFSVIKDMIYSSLKINTINNPEIFMNTSKNGENEMGNILDLFSALMNKVKE